MMSNIYLDNLGKLAKGEITLTGSKSISNRVLIIKALCKGEFDIENLSESDDTKTLVKLIASEEDVLDAHHAGTTFRFLTSYLSVSEENKKLTGSERMLQRPIGALVDALRKLGANIKYTGQIGYPPLEISGSVDLKGGKVAVDASISSQFLSSLLLIAPTFESGLELELVGDLVSRPYLEMTLRVMEYFGVKHTWHENVISVTHQSYVAKDFYVEADWSAASYYYSIAALSDEADIVLHGLQKDSLQGDSVIAEIGTEFRVKTTYSDRKIRLVKSRDAESLIHFEYNFINCPDIAQSVMGMCAGLGTQALYTGLQTLHIKETDRIAAMQTELAKVGVFLGKLPAKFSKKSDDVYYMQEGKATSEIVPIFATYHDHRMAMALAPLGMLLSVEVENKDVVSKSYPGFWEDVISILS